MSKVTLKSRRLAAENSKWRVYFDHIADAVGNEVLDYLVVAGRNLAPGNVTGVAVLPIIDDNFVLLRSYRHGIASDVWELPRGFIDQDETAATAAMRELGEETNLRCSPQDLVPLGHYIPEPSTMTVRGALFAARRCEGSLRKAADELGIGEPRTFTTEAIAKMIAAGEIEDAATLIAYYRFREIADG